MKHAERLKELEKNVMIQSSVETGDPCHTSYLPKVLPIETLCRILDTHHPG